MYSYIKQYKILHSQQESYGSSSNIYFSEVCLMIDYLKPNSILGFGCGKGILANLISNKYSNIKVFKYDPAIEEYSTIPKEKIDFIINTDVLKHIPEQFLPEVLETISSLSSKVFFGLYHAPAAIILPNGKMHIVRFILLNGIMNYLKNILKK